MSTVTVQVIKTEADYQEALRRLRQLLNAPPDTPEGDEADVYSTQSGFPDFTGLPNSAFLSRIGEGGM